MSSVIKKFYENFEEYLAAFFVLVMILCLLLQVIVRVTMGSSIAWTEELSRYTFIWAVYLGASMGIKHGAQIRITAQFLKMPVKGRIFFYILADIISVIGCVFIATEGLTFIYENMDYPEISPTLHVAKHWIEFIIPTSFLMIAWRTVEKYILVKKRNGSLADFVRYEEEA